MNGKGVFLLLKLSACVIVAAFLATEGLKKIEVMMVKAKTIGRVIDVDHDVVESDTQGSGEVTTGVYEFTVNGKKFYGHSPNYDKVGDNVPVLYNPKNPSENRAEGDEQPVVDYMMVLLAGGLFLYWAISSSWQELSDLRRMRRHETASE